jgi:hypothetical protein
MSIQIQFWIWRPKREQSKSSKDYALNVKASVYNYYSWGLEKCLITIGDYGLCKRSLRDLDKNSFRLIFFSLSYVILTGYFVVIYGCPFDAGQSAIIPYFIVEEPSGKYMR